MALPRLVTVGRAGAVHGGEGPGADGMTGSIARDPSRRRDMSDSVHLMQPDGSAALSCLRLGNVEVIRRFVAYPSHFARLRLATGFGGRSAADGMHTLDALRLTEDSGPRS